MMDMEQAGKLLCGRGFRMTCQKVNGVEWQVWSKYVRFGGGSNSLYVAFDLSRDRCAMLTGDMRMTVRGGDFDQVINQAEEEIRGRLAEPEGTYVGFDLDKDRSLLKLLEAMRNE